jgi:hypothetical protein
VKSLPKVSLARILPLPVGDPDFNRCPDPDCQNFGVGADMDVQRFLVRGSPARNIEHVRGSSSD